MWTPLTLRDWLSLFWFTLTAPRPKTVHAHRNVCPTCGREWPPNP